MTTTTAFSFRRFFLLLAWVPLILVAQRVEAANQAPTLGATNNVTVLEDSGTGTVNLTGIGDGDADADQTITITATSNNAALIPNPTVNYTSPAATGTLSFTPAANGNGSATITVTVKDNGGTADGGVDTLTRTFSINVTSVNDAPVINAITDVTVPEDNGPTVVTVAGIGDGDPDRNQSMSLTAVSSNPAFLPNPTVSYTSPATTGTLTLNPPAGQSGSATITVTLKDGGGTASGGVDTTVRTFTFTVTPVNDPPTLDTIVDLAILEGSGAQTVNLSGLSDGDPDQTQALTVTAVSSNPGLVPNPVVTYLSPDATGSLAFTPTPDLSGSAIITVTVKDDGGADNGGNDTLIRTFTVTVTPINKIPTLEALSSTTVVEDSVAQTVNLAGIGDGDPSLEQVITVTATSSNPTLIPNPTVTYVSPEATGSLVFTPAANQSGTADITVTVQDDGGTASGGVDTVTRTFTVTVTPVNDMPVIEALNDLTVLEDSAARIVNLTGLGDGDSDQAQTLTVTAVSNNPTLIADPTVTYTSPAATGTLSFIPLANQNGTAIITVTVQDNGGTAEGGVDTVARTFTVTVTAVNDKPVLDAITNVTVLEESGAGTVPLAGLGDGDPEATQVLTVTATSSNATVIPNPTVTYTSPDATGSLSFTPVANQSGTATITVTVQDDGGTANAGVDTVTRTFTITVTAINDAPTVEAIENITVLEDSGSKAVTLTGVSDGDPEQSQILTITAVSSNPAILRNPNVDYFSPDATGTLTLMPSANQNGLVTVTVTLQDDRGTANGGMDTTTRTFTVDITPVNDQPTFSVIADQSFPGNSGTHSVAINGIGDGDPQQAQDLTITATSGNPGLIPNPVVTYSSPNSSGTLAITPVTGQTGEAIVTVTLQDNGGTDHSGIDTLTRTFKVTVTAPVPRWVGAADLGGGWFYDTWIGFFYVYEGIDWIWAPALGFAYVAGPNDESLYLYIWDEQSWFWAGRVLQGYYVKLPDNVYYIFDGQTFHIVE